MLTSKAYTEAFKENQKYKEIVDAEGNLDYISSREFHGRLAAL